MNDYIVGELAAARRRGLDIEADRTRSARRIRTDVDATVTRSARVSVVGTFRSARARTSALVARLRLGAA